jgi:hypothetical protein
MVDAVTDEGSFENMLKNIKASNNVDVRELITCLNNRISVVSEIVPPIDANSEKFLVGIGIRKNDDYARQQVKNFFGSALKVDSIEDIEIYSEAIDEQEETPDLFGDLEEEFEEDEDQPAVHCAEVCRHPRGLCVDFERPRLPQADRHGKAPIAQGRCGLRANPKNARPVCQQRRRQPPPFRSA